MWESSRSRVLVLCAALIGGLACVASSQFEMAGKGVIEGCVWLPDGAAAVGARVTCQGYGRRLSRELAPPLQLETVTDEAGAYRFEVFNEGVYILRVELDGYATEISEMVRPDEPTDFYLSRGQKVSGRVTIAETGEPVYRARAYLIYDYGRIGPVETNRNGEFRFAHAPLRQMKALFIEVIHLGLANTEVEHLKVTEDAPVEVDFRVRRGGVLVGQVVNMADEKPVANLRLRLASALRGEQFVETDPRGFYRAEGLAKGVVTAVALDERVDLLEPFRARAWVEEGQTTVMDLKATPKVTIQGVVKNPRGEPVADALVDFSMNYFNDYINRAAYPRPLPMPGLVRLLTRNVRTGPDGRFVDKTLTSGQYTAVAWTPGFVVTEGPQFVVTLRRAADNVEIILKDGATVTGTVSDAQGQPIAAAEVRAQPLIADADFGNDPTLEDAIAFTDAAGRYTLHGLPPQGQWAMRARAHGYTVASANIKEIKACDLLKVDFQLETAPVIRGRVLSSAGQPIRRVTVEVSGKPDRVRTNRRIVMTDADGFFTAHAAGLPPYRLLLQHPHYNRELREGISAAEPLEVTMYRYGAVEGEFINYPEDYTRDILVAAKTTDGKHVRHENFPARTRVFRIDRLYPGTYTLFAVDHESFYEARTGEFEVEEGEMTRDIKMYFKRRTD